MLAIGKEAHAQRERHGWSQEAVARAAGLHPETVETVERSAGDPRLSTVVRLFYVLGFEMQFGLRHTP